MLETNNIYLWDCLETMKKMSDNSVDAIVTDPPYWLSFMGKKRDYDVPSQEIREEALRVLKPWWYLLSFAGTRTYHRMACAIEDAGFEVRDMIEWVYGSGFPKSLNIGKAVDKFQGNERKEIGANPNFRKNGIENNFTKEGTFATTEGMKVLTKGTSEWEGRWTALKPAHEPICIARKPLAEKTVAENCLKYGTGGINIDWCRVGTDNIKLNIYKKWVIPFGENAHNKEWWFDEYEKNWRFPANLIHDWSDEVVELFPNDSQRFFYCAKASKSERNMWCEELEEKDLVRQGLAGENNNPKHQNNHPTVKPIALMEYLIKLVTKEWAIVLDPFAWSWSTLVACKKLKRQYIGCEMTEEYIPIIKARLESVREREKSLFEQI